MWQHSSDIPDAFFAALVDMCTRLDCRPADIASCWMSESNMWPHAHNTRGGATGIFQAMPDTLEGLGYHGTWQDFAGLSAVQQLHWAEHYYGPHKGRLTSPGACYLATFLPALMVHANEPSFVLCSRHGPFQKAYEANYGAFDPSGKGWITVRNLTERIERVATGGRWNEIVTRLTMAQQNRETTPELPLLSSIDEEPDVTCVTGQQCAFQRLGYPCDVDGVYGSQTRAACTAFQGDHPPLICDGVCGPKTQELLAQVLANSAE